MHYLNLGLTDIKVSRICMGTMTFGEQNSEVQSKALLDLCIDMDVNFFDTAEMYSFPCRLETQGDSERHIGNWMFERRNRDKVVIATKITGPSTTSFSHIRNGDLTFGYRQIKEAVESSLRRLKTDYIDLYQLHWPERTTNFFGKLGYEHHDDEEWTLFQETLDALARMCDAGKLRSIGCSNETPWGLMKMLSLSSYDGFPTLASIQNPYNLLNRTYEIGLAEISIRENCGLLAYSPLAFGALTGKYLNGALPKQSRLALYPEYTRYTKPRSIKATEAYVALAQEHGLDPAQMALAYVNTRKFTTANIIGATNQEQLKKNILSDSIHLSKEVLCGIENIHNMDPNPAP